MGHLINRRTRELSKEDIKLIAETYHNWRASTGSAPEYKNIKGFCKAATIDEVKKTRLRFNTGALCWFG